MNWQKVFFVPRALADCFKVLFNTDEAIKLRVQLCIALLKLKWKHWSQPAQNLAHIRLYNNAVVCFNALSTQFLLKEIFYQGVYKPFVKIKEEAIIIDAGANIGMAALYLQNAVKVVNMICIEPDADNFLMLKKNLSIGNAKHELVAAALSTNNGTISFEKKDNLSSLNKKFHGPEPGDELVNAISLLPYLTMKPALIKMDIEGAEWEILEQIISQKKLQAAPYWMIEFHEIDQHKTAFATIKNAFAKLNFEVKKRGDVWHFFCHK